MTQDNNNNKKEVKHTLTKDQIYLKSLDSEQARSMVAVYYTLTKTPTNSFIAKDIIQTMQGTSDKSIFNLGVLAGQNTVLRQLKAVASGVATDTQEGSK